MLLDSSSVIIFQLLDQQFRYRAQVEGRRVVVIGRMDVDGYGPVGPALDGGTTPATIVDVSDPTFIAGGTFMPFGEPVYVTPRFAKNYFSRPDVVGHTDQLTRSILEISSQGSTNIAAVRADMTLIPFTKTGGGSAVWIPVRQSNGLPPDEVLEAMNLYDETTGIATTQLNPATDYIPSVEVREYCALELTAQGLITSGTVDIITPAYHEDMSTADFYYWALGEASVSLINFDPEVIVFGSSLEDIDPDLFYDTLLHYPKRSSDLPLSAPNLALVEDKASPFIGSSYLQDAVTDGNGVFQNMDYIGGSPLAIAVWKVTIATPFQALDTISIDTNAEGPEVFALDTITATNATAAENATDIAAAIDLAATVTSLSAYAQGDLVIVTSATDIITSSVTLTPTNAMIENVGGADVIATTYSAASMSGLRQRDFAYLGAHVAYTASKYVDGCQYIGRTVTIDADRDGAYDQKTWRNYFGKERTNVDGNINGQADDGTGLLGFKHGTHDWTYYDGIHYDDDLNAVVNYLFYHTQYNDNLRRFSWVALPAIGDLPIYDDEQNIVDLGGYVRLAAATVRQGFGGKVYSDTGRYLTSFDSMLAGRIGILGYNQFSMELGIRFASLPIKPNVADVDDLQRHRYVVPGWDAVNRRPNINYIYTGSWNVDADHRSDFSSAHRWDCMMATMRLLRRVARAYKKAKATPEMVMTFQKDLEGAFNDSIKAGFIEAYEYQVLNTPELRVLETIIVKFSIVPQYEPRVIKFVGALLPTINSTAGSTGGMRTTSNP